MLSIETIREEAGEKEYALGVSLYRRAMVRERKRTETEALYTVVDDRTYQVTVTPLGPECDCGRADCGHCVAAMLAAGADGSIQEMERSLMESGAPALLDAVASALPVADRVLLRPVLLFQNGACFIALKAGEERLYVVRSIPRFLQARETGEEIPFGKGFTYQPRWMRFGEKEEALLDVLADLYEQNPEPMETGPAARVVRLKPRAARRVLDALREMEFELRYGEESRTVEGIADLDTNLTFQLTGSFRELRLTCQVPRDLREVTRDGEYMWADGCVVHVPEKDRRLLRVLSRYHRSGKALFIFAQGDTPRVLSELFPALLAGKNVVLGEELEKKMTRLPLDARVYLDQEGGDITCRTAFRYGETELDPFASGTDEARMLLIRDVKKEYAILDELARDGFHVQGGKVYLRGNDRIWEFINGGAVRLSESAEVYMSRDFKKITVRRPRLRGFLKYTSGQLQLEVYDGEEKIEELMPLMEALRRNRRYFRFRDGSFVDLEGIAGWQDLAREVGEAVEATGREDDLGACRAAYLTALIREKQLPVEEDEGTRALTEMRFVPAPSPVEGLREYQKRGYEWLCALHSMGLGGILADEMGLGKTVQMIAAMERSRLDEKEKRPCLVVAPTSLTYNWMSEIHRFAPDMKVMLIRGNQAARKEQIERIGLSSGPDVVITSYPLIRRDIDLLTPVLFRYAVLDEAQHVKNAQSVGAHAVRRLQAETRVALTGTPMENHAGELWSLFDYVLPGYLPKYNDYMRRWGEGRDEESLRLRIRPFLMRRLKKDVLGELPEKQEHVILAEMSQEQRQIYDASLLQKRARVREILTEKGLGRGRGEVLSAITELREICCHPQLCLKEYTGASGKLELLMDILPEAVARKRRILLFSQFTSMLRLIRQRLAEEGYSTLYLDGDTPAEERLDLTRRFNDGEGSVFLISLKAGGTGLNLTGADMVIHYDPWWNPTAEEQATGRAHRIGQTRKVEVWKLIMHSSVEEQVLKMSERKRQMFDRLITPGEEMPTRLTEKDILALFEA